MTARAGQVLRDAVEHEFSGDHSDTADNIYQYLEDHGVVMMELLVVEEADDDEVLPGPAASAAPPVGAGSIGEAITAGQPPVDLGSVDGGISQREHGTLAATAGRVESDRPDSLAGAPSAEDKVRDLMAALEASVAAAKAAKSVYVCSTCDHPESAHRDEPGFYDDRGGRRDCDYVGCPCTSYRPAFVGAKRADR